MLDLAVMAFVWLQDRTPPGDGGVLSCKPASAIRLRPNLSAKCCFAARCSCSQWYAQSCIWSLLTRHSRTGDVKLWTRPVETQELLMLVRHICKSEQKLLPTPDCHKWVLVHVADRSSCC